ncbi:cell wall glycosyl hydrolase [Pseudomassariella vexata]|uniref:Mannan endo-1,6-alpha-mannosidase n=1 Tax=Pseudomassariella vexata TaxID=1141098 RepID=A0A1Y2E3J2_9PEZI|nr:cell wall glycosyl hydrolase [Pseudomassariella vexata]ORY66121.1 cell wall glycosyl hydrolase [Pseudomassariella vexata]
MRSSLGGVGLLGLIVQSVAAVDITWSDPSSIKSGTSEVAYGLVKFYTGNNTGDVPGNLPDPYYWWEAGAFFTTLIEYWAYTGDTTYNAITKQAMIHQAGDDLDFMPTNQTRSEGNDDQGFWALASMTAAEMNFTNPSSSEPQWLALTQAVFNEYVSRWDNTTCNGGLRWQIFTFNNGYNYKNSVSNGCFFDIAARLARYTGNETYAEWAEKVFNWQMGVGFITDDWDVMDGAGNGDDSNCTEINGALFTYNAGLYLHGAAYMYNYTDGSELWRSRLAGLVNSTTRNFFKDNIMYELSCETAGLCNVDQQSFKGHLSRWMAMAAKMAPFTYDTIVPLLTSSATAAAQQCSGTSSDFKGTQGTACGFSWLQGSTWDSKTGIGEQMNALSIMITPLIDEAPTPYTSDTGGSSTGNTEGGSSDSSKIQQERAITTADRAGAGILTAFILAGLAGGVFSVTI